MRCDLHVHTTASGLCNTPGLSICRESYSDPVAVYDRLKRLGMSIFTLTDHDSIDGAEALRHHQNFFLSEEVTVTLPTGTEMHLGVYAINERDHTEIQRRRKDFVALLMYLTERKIFFSVNHLFSGLTGRRDSEDFDWFASYVPAFETRNGQMWSGANASAQALADRLGKISIAGSDSHTIAGVGKTYTEVAGAQTVEEFFAGLRKQRGTVNGVHGGALKLTADVYLIIASLFKEKPWLIPVFPITAFVPLVTVGHWLNEIRFSRKWSGTLLRGKRQPRMIWSLEANVETNLAG
ncbi:MAG TPA: PHP-associated domain-containing protein [Candidatus Acidoferrum sp.]|jgi:predicted metal-dependent phosphoesterase TrpH